MADSASEQGGGAQGDETVGADRAARELGLMRGEFELAVELGHIGVLARGQLGRRRVARSEIERIRSARDFPQGLRDRVRTVGAAQGAETMGISPGRFVRLARAGLLTPARFYLNRYRAVVWLYLADELTAFAAAEPLLLRGRLPVPLRIFADHGDCRGRNWRARRVGALLRQAQEPRESLAAASAALAAEELDRLVPDPQERAGLLAARPRLVSARPTTQRASEVLHGLVVARDAEEIAWYAAQVKALVEVAKPRPEAGEAGETGVSTGHRGAEAGVLAGTPGPAGRVRVTMRSSEAPPESGRGRASHDARCASDATTARMGGTGPSAAPAGGCPGETFRAAARRADLLWGTRVDVPAEPGRNSEGRAPSGQDRRASGPQHVTRPGLLGRLRGRRGAGSDRTDMVHGAADTSTRAEAPHRTETPQGADHRRRGDSRQGAATRQRPALPDRPDSRHAAGTSRRAARRVLARRSDAPPGVEVTEAGAVR
jgi:hypothetical protein